MKSYLLITVMCCVLSTSGFAQEQILGMSKKDAIAQIPHKSGLTLDGKNYPLIKETLQLDGIDALKLKDIRDWDNVSTVYLFIDSSDRVCRLHMVYNDLPGKERDKIVADLTQKANSQLDKTDKKHTTYIGKTKDTDYILTWAKDKNRKSTYLLVTDYGYKLKMLNHLINGGTLPDDGIFTPAPSK
jgi:hypothetical protein